MPEEFTDITITVELTNAGWRAIIYQNGVAVKMSPASNDRDIAMLYAREISDRCDDMKS